VSHTSALPRSGGGGWREVSLLWLGYKPQLTRLLYGEGDGSPYGERFLLTPPPPNQGNGTNGWIVWTCLWVQVSVTAQRPQNKDLPVFCNKHNCDRGSQKSKPGICRHSARLSALLMNPRTVSMGSWLDHIDLLKRPQSGL